LKQIILGTAGHIDHGKTSLIKAITGTNTDRLKEEIERGITIELGFASLTLPSGQHVAIVDVPGHEKFVKNMVAGASGIDMVAMIIAADEGVMPQTREHLEICSLLGIKHGMVVLTKIDMVDEEWLELVREDVREFVKGTFLEDRPILPVSSTTLEGIPEFLKALDEEMVKVPERPSTSLFRLPVDRVFSMKGFGTVITGSLISGSIRVGDAIMIYPTGITSKVRGIQVHNDMVDEAHAGMRTAVNFQGLDKDSVNRGDILARPDTLKPSFMVDALLTYLNSNRKPAKNRTRVRLHTGTSEIQGILILLDRDEILPGESAPVQLRLDEPVTLVRDDRFVVRSYSPVRTIGGGFILNPIPEKHKRFRPEIAEGLTRIAKDGPEKIIDYHAAMAGYKGVSFSDLKLMTNQSEKPLNQLVQGLLSNKTLILTDRENQIYLHQATFENIKKDIILFLNDFHQANPLKPGMSKEELKSKFPLLQGSKTFNQALDQLIKTNEAVLTEDLVRLAGHKVSLGIDQEEARNKIVEACRNGGLMPPYFRDIAKSLDMEPQKAKDVLMHLVEEGAIVKTKDDLFFDATAVADLKQRLVQFLETNGEIDTPRFKDLTGASRKYVIPLIEYFDATNVTIRVGDIRKLRKR